MADISAIFDDVLYPVALKNKVTGGDVGITMWVAPFEADAETDWYIRTRAQVERMKAGDGDVPIDKFAEIDALSMRKRCIKAVRKWEWNGNSFGDLGVDPECTIENKTAVFNHDRTDWIVDQIVDAGANIKNFTTPPKQD